MVEDTIATYIEDNTSFVKGEDIFLFELPEGTSEGILLRPSLENLNETDFERQILNILLFYRSYGTGASNYETLKELFNGYRGTTDGTWTVSSPVEGNKHGKDKYLRYVFSLSFEISFDKTI